MEQLRAKRDAARCAASQQSHKSTRQRLLPGFRGFGLRLPIIDRNYLPSSRRPDMPSAHRWIVSD
jgi:hypothetical protein